MIGPHGPGISRNRPAPPVAFGGLAHETNTFNPVPTGRRPIAALNREVRYFD